MLSVTYQNSNFFYKIIYSFARLSDLVFTVYLEFSSKIAVAARKISGSIY